MNLRGLLVISFVVLLSGVLVLRAGQSQNNDSSVPTEIDGITAEMHRLDAEIWRLSLACAGVDAVAPLQEQLNQLAVQLDERRRERGSSLDQGGDNCTSVTVIPSLPYTDTGTTAGYNDDFTTICFPGGSAPDVVYRFTPNVDMTVDVSLCGSSYNTVLSVWRDCPGTDQPILICCNDDSPDCAPQSCCSGIDLARSIAYYFVVDGAPGQSGNYQLTVDLSVLPSCFVGTGCVVCPPGASYETEVCPAVYPDPNAGPACFGSGYETIACGETMCGKATHTATWLDKDAYWVTLTQRDSIRFCILAEFDLTVTIYEYAPA